MPKFTICVTQMVEQLGTFEIKAEDAEQARQMAGNMPLFEACEKAGTWGPGDDADRAEIWAVHDASGEAVWER